ncbi:MAG: serine hydrolase domain-containing protein, partial [Bacteroidota bacterium]
MKRLLLIPTLLLSLFGFSQEVDLQSIVNSKSGEEDPAVFAGVVQDGEIIFKTIRGMANLEHQIKANENTRSNIASTAKQFTALMVLDLSQKGKLSLEDDIRKYYPNLYPDIKEEIKIRHLLNHTSGIRDYCDLLGLEGKAWWRRMGLDNDDVVDLIAEQKTLAFVSGTDYTYSNTGYNLLAEIIAKVTDKDFVEYSTQFFQELGMTQTAFPDDYMQVIPNMASPYSDWGDGVFQKYPYATSTYGEGFLFTTLDDQLHYEQLL